LKYSAFVERLISILSLRFIIKMFLRSKEKYTFVGILWSEFINIIVIGVPLIGIGLTLTSLSDRSFTEDIVWISLTLAVAVIVPSALNVSRTGKNIGFHSAGFIIQTTDGRKVKILQAFWRQLLFTVWILGNIFIGIPLVLTTIFLIITKRFSKYPRSIYDLLAGTAPVIKKVEFEEPLHNRKDSLSKRVFKIMLSELVDITFIVALGFGLGYLALISYPNIIIQDIMKFWGSGPIIFLAIITISAVWLFNRGKTTPGLYVVGFVIKPHKVEKITIYRALWRQFLFVLWTLSNIALGIPWLIIGPIIIRFSKSHRNIYDILTGTTPELKGESTYERKFSSQTLKIKA
jgi:hypothetical protein